MAKKPQDPFEAGIGGRNPNEFLKAPPAHADADEGGKKGKEIPPQGKKYPRVSIQGAGILSRLSYRQLVGVLIATGVLGFGYAVYDELDTRANPPSADLTELTERAVTKFSPLMAGYEKHDSFFERSPHLADRAGHRSVFASPESVDEFCSEVEDYIKDKYIGKDGIADVKCSATEVKITTEDGTVVTSTPKGTSITGPGASLSADFRAVVDHAVRTHSTSDDFFAETGFTTPFYTGKDGDTVCNNIINEINQRFAEELKSSQCDPYTMRFTSESGETITATPYNGITVKTDRPPPKKPGS